MSVGISSSRPYGCDRHHEQKQFGEERLILFNRLQSREIGAETQGRK